MKTLKYLLLFFGVAILSVACSKDSNDGDDNDKESLDTIIGEWTFYSENDYQCFTDEFLAGITADNRTEVIKVVFEKTGVWHDLVDGIQGYSGTWINKGEGIYVLEYDHVDTINPISIEFVEKDVMRFNNKEYCSKTEGSKKYTYVIWHRTK